MRCFCEHNETNDLKIEADVDSDPIWCNQCGSNFDIEEAPILQTRSNIEFHS